ncbi:MAG: DUF2797 domain-containing protein [Chitinophagales bacterium]
MNIAGNILKMRTDYLNKNNPESLNKIQYSLPIGENMLSINNLIGTKIQLIYEGLINCVVCGKKTKKSFGQGSCYTCFMTAPQNSPCIINPELCEAHLGKGRNVEWEEKNHNKEHIVYLAKSSAIKIGVTGDFPMTRWIDQGASEAIILAKVPYRQLAGEIEVMMKDYFTDKTNWRNMLKNIVSDVDLLETKEECFDYLPEDYHEFIDEEDILYEMQFPMENYPNKIKSIGFDKIPIIEGVLQGVKGQYLYFEDGKVLNMRKHTGYYLSINY